MSNESLSELEYPMVKKPTKILATSYDTYIKIYPSSLLYHSARMNILMILEGEAGLGISKQHEVETKK